MFREWLVKLINPLCLTRNEAMAILGVVWCERSQCCRFSITAKTTEQKTPDLHVQHYKTFPIITGGLVFSSQLSAVLHLSNGTVL